MTRDEVAALYAAVVDVDREYAQDDGVMVPSVVPTSADYVAMQRVTTSLAS